MKKYSKNNLQEGIKSLQSTLNKCEKVILKLKEGTSSHTLTARRIDALKIAIDLMNEKLQNTEYIL